MHDTSSTAKPTDAITRIYAEEILSAFREQMQDVERLAGELHDLLAHYETMIEREGQSGEIETLMRWAEIYNSGLSAAGKMSRDGQSWLCGLNHRLTHEVAEPDTACVLPSPVKPSFAQANPFASAARQVGIIPLHSTERNNRFFPVRRFRAQ